MDVYGKNGKISMKTCCICGRLFPEGSGNNPDPVKPLVSEDGSENECCNNCNASVVVPVRDYIGKKISEVRNQ